MKEKLKDYVFYGVAISIFLALWGGCRFIFQSDNLWGQSGLLLLIGFVLVRKAYLWYRDIYVFRSHVPKDLWSTEHDPETFTTFYRTQISGHSVQIEEREILNELQLRIERGGEFIWGVQGTNRWQLMAMSPHIVMVVAPIVIEYKNYELAGPLKPVFKVVLKDLKKIASKTVAHPEKA